MESVEEVATESDTDDADDAEESAGEAGGELALERAGLATSDDIVVGGHLVTGATSEPGTLNPNLTSDDQAARVAAMIFSPLVASDLPFNTPVSPALAEDWEVNDEATVYTFYLDQDARFHDGEPVTSADVKWTMEAIIENSGRQVPELATVDTIDAPDDHTVVVNMSEPNAAFLTNMGIPFTVFILPKHLMEDVPWEDNEFLSEPVGSGPFVFDEWERGSFLSVVANDDFFLGRPAIDRITMRFYDLPGLIEAYRSGEVKYAYDRLPSSELAAFQDDPAYRIDMLFLPQAEWVGFDLSNPKFEDVRVREAFAIAIDRDEISRRVHGGVWAPNAGVMPRGPAYNEETEFEYDPERAIELLEEAGFMPDENGVRLEAVYSVGTFLSQSDSGAIMREQLAEVGIDLTLDAMDWPTYSEVVVDRKEFEITSGGGWAGPDPDQTAEYIVTGGGQNRMGYSNPRVDELYEMARQTRDEDQRLAYYLEAQEHIFEDVPRFNVLDVGNNHPIWSCVMNPWFEESLADERYNLFQGFLYTWLEPECSA